MVVDSVDDDGGKADDSEFEFEKDMGNEGSGSCAGIGGDMGESRG